LARDDGVSPIILRREVCVVGNKFGEGKNDLKSFNRRSTTSFGRLHSIASDKMDLATSFMEV
jgi:hypothetical protein